MITYLPMRSGTPRFSRIFCAWASGPVLVACKDIFYDVCIALERVVPDHAVHVKVSAEYGRKGAPGVTRFPDHRGRRNALARASPREVIEAGSRELHHTGA